ncbi:MAG: hypothetical protein AB1736_10815 [Chloroflexota bacterium]
MSAPASHERVYRALLRLYPEPFRTRFGDELVQLAGDVLRDARTGRNAGRGVARTWLGLIMDVALTAPAEHLEHRRVAHSLSRPASMATRILGVVGVIGGLVLLAAYVPNLPWTQEVFVLRLVVFNGGAIAIAAAMLRPSTTAVLGRVARATAIAMILANAWYAVMVLMSFGRPQYPDPDPEFREIFLWVAVAMWWLDAAFGLTMLRLRGLARWGGLALAIGSVGAFTGMGHLQLIDGDFGWFFYPAALGGVALNGIGWVALGVVVVTRRRPRDDARSPVSAATAATGSTPGDA